MRGRLLPAEVADRIVMLVLLVAVATGSVWGLVDAGHDGSPAPAATASTAPPALRPATTAPATPPTTVPPLGDPGGETRPEAFAGLGRLAHPSGGRVIVLDGDGGAPRAVTSVSAPVTRWDWSPTGDTSGTIRASSCPAT